MGTGSSTGQKREISEWQKYHVIYYSSMWWPFGSLPLESGLIGQKKHSLGCFNTYGLLCYCTSSNKPNLASVLLLNNSHDAVCFALISTFGLLLGPLCIHTNEPAKTSLGTEPRPQAGQTSLFLSVQQFEWAFTQPQTKWTIRANKPGFV